MAIPKRLLDAKGLWKGKSQLNLPYLPSDERVSESASELRIDENGAYATVSYTWEHGGEAQEGTMIVAMDAESKAVQIGWVDSWHQSAGVLHLVGAEAEDGAVGTQGSWLAGDETWGWTIGFDRTDGDGLAVTMEVLPADGDAEWAVRAVYQRS